jgi:glycogen(starch) synthase
MVVAGDGPCRQELENLASDLGIFGAVTFRGWISPDDVAREINDSTVVVMPSRFGEAFGLVALEAAQMARPVIASRVGGLPEVVWDERTGLLVEPDTPSALADAMLRVLEDRDLAARLGRSGREHAARFTIDRYTDEYDSLYRQLTEETIDVNTT